MLQWMDDFTSYGTDAGRVARMLNGAYADLGNVDLIVDPDGTAGGKYCLAVTRNINSRIRKVLSGPMTTVGVAARYWLTGLPANTSCVPMLASFSDISNAGHGFICVNPSGYLQAFITDSGQPWVLLGESDGPVIVANAWQHIETKIVIDAVNGSIEVRVDGYTRLDIPSIRTAAVGAAASVHNVSMADFLQGSGTGQPDFYVKDFIIWDGTGALNNDFMGSCQVYKIIPDGDVSLGWTPNAGVTGYNKINETTPDDDTGYISAAYPPPAPSEFTLTDLPANVTSVRGVMSLHRSRKTDGGDGNLQTTLIYGGSSEAGSDRAITTAYTYWSDVFDQAPGGINWTRAIVNDLHLKLNRTV